VLAVVGTLFAGTDDAGQYRYEVGGISAPFTGCVIVTARALGAIGGPAVTDTATGVQFRPAAPFDSVRVDLVLPAAPGIAQ